MTWWLDIAKENLLVAAVIFIPLRAAAIVVAPIPGAALDIPAVQVFGWKLAFVLSELGTMLGALTSFWIARRLRQTKLGRFVAGRLRLDRVEAWQQRLPSHDQFLAWIALRLPTNVAFDYISYAAGLTNCSAQMFFWTTLIGNVPITVVFFYLAGIGFKYGSVTGWILPLSFLALFSIPVTLRLRQKVTHRSPAAKSLANGK